MTNPIVEKVEGWIWQIAVKKGVISLVKVIVAFITSVKLDPVLKQVGVTVDPVTLTGGLTALITSGLTMLQNYLKQKYGLNWL
jgi:hypothetical protein